MNYAQDLYEKLMSLVTSGNEAFYKRDYEQDGKHYRIFAYRLASYTEFLLPGALECRGAMFEITDPSQSVVQMVRLAALPMEKFFNWNENPFTMNLDVNNIIHVESKADGSLISTYWHEVGDETQLGIKSKTSINSTQVHDVKRFLNKEANSLFYDELLELSLLNYTVNMEYCAPDNRVIIGYMQPKLVVLNVRDNTTGLYVPKDELNKKYHTILSHWVESHEVVNREEFFESIRQTEQIEGYVLTMSNGQRVKVKTDWYVSLHRAKDSINSNKRLYETVLSESSDDLKSMFSYDELIVYRINEMEKYVRRIHDKLCHDVDVFYEDNKHLDRKSFAVKGKEVLDGHAFKIAIERYIGRDTPVNVYMLNRWKDFGGQFELEEVTEND